MFNKKKPINKLEPFNTTGARLEDNTGYVAPKKKAASKPKPSTKTVKKK